MSRVATLPLSLAMLAGLALPASAQATRQPPGPSTGSAAGPAAGSTTGPATTPSGWQRSGATWQQAPAASSAGQGFTSQGFAAPGAASPGFAVPGFTPQGFTPGGFAFGGSAPSGGVIQQGTLPPGGAPAPSGSVPQPGASPDLSDNYARMVQRRQIQERSEAGAALILNGIMPRNR